MKLQSGNIAHCKDGVFSQGGDEDYEGRPYAAENTIVVGKNGPVLNAWGGGCRVISLSREDINLGALIHISATEYTTDKYRELINILIAEFPSFKHSATRVKVCGDVNEEEILDADSLELEFDAWNKEIVEYLTQLGFKDVENFRKGGGKDVYLDTRTSVIKIFDDQKNEIL